MTRRGVGLSLAAVFLSLMTAPAVPIHAQSRPADWREVFFRSGTTPDLERLSFTRCDDGVEQAAVLQATPDAEVMIGSGFAATPSGESTTAPIPMPRAERSHNIRVRGLYCRGGSEVVVHIENTFGQGILLDRLAVDESEVLLIRTPRFGLLQPAHLEQVENGRWILVADDQVPSDRRLLTVGTQVMYRPRQPPVGMPGRIAEIIETGPNGPVICPVIDAYAQAEGTILKLGELSELQIPWNDVRLSVDLDELLESLHPICRS